MTHDRKASKPSESDRDAGNRCSDALPIILDAGDRYHQVIEADKILYDRLTGSQFIVAFFVIERCDGSSYDVFQLDRTVTVSSSPTVFDMRKTWTPKLF